MTREGVDVKARRYLAEGRLRVRHVDEAAGTVRAEVRGAGAVYNVAYGRESGWSCNCPARGTCCRVTAVGLVVAIEQKALPRAPPRSQPRSERNDNSRILRRKGSDQ